METPAPSPDRRQFLGALGGGTLAAAAARDGGADRVGRGPADALGTALAVATGNRLQTGLGTLVVPALYFAFFPVRALAGDSYEDFYLYLLDVNYHFGNAFVFLIESLNGSFSAETQAYITTFTGVYDPEQADVESENLPESLDLVGHVDPVVSLLAIAALSVGLLLLAAYRFERMDV